MKPIYLTSFIIFLISALMFTPSKKNSTYNL